MSDPVTVGTLTVTALCLAGEAIVRGTVGELVKDAYAKLKSAVSTRAPNEIRSLEAQPTSESRRAKLVETLDALPECEATELVVPAQTLVDALQSNGENHPIGVDLTRLRAMNLRFNTIRVASGTGVIVRDACVQGDVTFDLLEVGGPQGKAMR
jgi:hypothetical protein